jgi:hypothetical protein
VVAWRASKFYLARFVKAEFGRPKKENFDAVCLVLLSFLKIGSWTCFQPFSSCEPEAARRVFSPLPATKNTIDLSLDYARTGSDSVAT